MFSLCPHLGGGLGVSPAGGGGSGQSSRGGQSSWGGSVQPVGAVQSSRRRGGWVSPARGGVSQVGGASVSGGVGGQYLAPSCGRYASCVHAGGLSCLILYLMTLAMKSSLTQRKALLQTENCKYVSR